MIVGHPLMLSGVLNNEELLRMDIPVFVSKLMASEQLFNNLCKILTNNHFEIMSRVDSVDVLMIRELKRITTHIRSTNCFKINQEFAVHFESLSIGHDEG
jgi:hypothetical protein